MFRGAGVDVQGCRGTGVDVRWCEIDFGVGFNDNAYRI